MKYQEKVITRSITPKLTPYEVSNAPDAIYNSVIKAYSPPKRFATVGNNEDKNLIFKNSTAIQMIKIPSNTSFGIFLSSTK